MGEDKKANITFKEALRESKSLDYIVGEIRSQIALSQLYNKLGSYNKSIELAKVALRNMEFHYSIDYEVKIRNVLYKNHKALGKNKESFEALKAHFQVTEKIKAKSAEKELINYKYQHKYEVNSLKDSIRSMEANKVIDAEISSNQAKIEEKHTIIFLLLFGSMVLGLLVVIVIRNRVRTRKEQSLIEDQKNKITSRIQYSENIQQALLPDIDFLKEFVSNI